MEQNIKKITYIIIIFICLFSMSSCKKRDNSNHKTATTTDSTTVNIKNDITSKDLNLSEEYTTFDSPLLTVIVDDFGNFNENMKNKLLYKFASLPKGVTFAIMPNVTYTKRVAKFFESKDKDVIIHVPMEPINQTVNAGKVVIKHDDSKQLIQQKFSSFMKQIPNAIGMNNHMGSLTTQSERVMTDIIQLCASISSRSFVFVDSRTIAQSVGFKIAQDLNYLSAERKYFLDVPTSSQRTIDDYLEKMKNNYSNKENILVITHCHDVKRYDNLKYFINECQNLGYKLVDLKTFAKANSVNSQN